MYHVRFCILGAGPSGLAFAAKLLRLGVDSFVLLEKENDVGGLCRSMSVDGAPLDIGGGHFLDVKRKHVLEFLFQYMPKSEWTEHTRISKIRICNTEVDHPLEGNLWQLPIAQQIEFLESIAQAGCVNGTPEPTSFGDWIRWKLGDRISEEYMLPYNHKMWMMPLHELGTYWLYKLPSVSFRETLQSCLEKKAGGNLPAHGTFLYPRDRGYGEVWRRIGKSLDNRLVTSYNLKAIDLKRKTVDNFSYDTLVTSIPWPTFSQIAHLPEQIKDSIGELKHTSVDVDYHPEVQETSSHWTYEPSEKFSYHRLLFRHNFATGARGYWTETNSLRAEPIKHFRHHNPYAYPVNTRNKPKALAKILPWAKLNQIVPLGRWGTWEHMNSDVAVEQALRLAEECIHA